MISNVKKLLVLLIALSGFIGFSSQVFGQAACNSAQECQDLIKQYQDQITTLQGQAKTLKNQIAQFNAQIYLTSLKIADTENKIQTLGGRIDQLETSLNDLTAAFTSRAVETYKLSRFENNFLFLLSASDVNDAVERFHYLTKIQAEDTSLMEQLQTAQTQYKGEKQTQEDLQKTLQAQKDSLNTQKAAKNTLLSQTQGSEARYQTLLSQARAALAALSSYAESVGITLIPHQDLSDGWGKYYNQRDSNWGNTVMNGSNDCSVGGKSAPCTLALVGCLATSYAMVVSHYGGSLQPADIALNSSYFFGGTAFFNNGVSANGHSVNDISNPSLQQLRDALNAGNAVIAGLSINGGPYPQHYSDHWVVLRSVDGDSFKINDPEYPGAMNVSLKDHYGSWTIIQAKIYN